MLSLDRLFTRAGIGRYDQDTWFKTARLVWPDLLVADEDAAGFIERNYLPKFIPHGVVRVLRVAPVKPKPKPKRWIPQPEPEQRSVFDGGPSTRLLGWKP